jgi:calmodulin|eukprot:scaffold6322_cov246-Chaetoceros_neogracile.AAC.3
MPNTIETKETPSTPTGTVTSNELKELKRVFGQLCYFAEKAPKKDKLKEIQEKLAEIRRPGNGYSSNDVPDESDSMNKLEAEKQRLEDELKTIESRPEQHIKPQDTGIAMKVLGQRISKREIQDLMWEVDEKVDGVIDWEEFHLMFKRNVEDTSGLEPSSFYYMVQFMIYDRNTNGKVSIDESMNMLYGRLGRARMEVAITRLFGGEDGSPIVEVGNQGGEIDFARFLAVSKTEQRKLFQSSELGRNLAEKKRKGGRSPK